MNDKTKSADFRNITINEEQQATKFSSNKIVTAKYNVFTFFPLFVLNQLRNYSTLFFLTVAAIQQFPGVSPMGRYTTLVPLIVIQIVTAAKDIFEDVLHHREDAAINYRTTEIRSSSAAAAPDGYALLHWENVKVGQIIRVRNNLNFPADLFLVGSSDEAGIAYIETSNLDGESNLKRRRVPLPLLEIDELDDLTGTVVTCDHPNEMIYSFHGVLALRTGTEVPLNERHILLRGATLKDTDWVCGVVMYTGVDTKIWRNLRRANAKRSSSEDIINRHMVALSGVFLVLVVANSVMYFAWNYRKRTSAWYLPADVDYSLNVFTFLTFAVIYSFIIPISLQIYLEISRVFQVGYINGDEQMYDESKATYAKAVTSKLNSDLGEVKYVFTDKTGTLTRNEQELKACSINGRVYETKDMRSLVAGCVSGDLCHHFLVAICVCPGIVSIYNEAERRWKYYSSSTDQLVLVKAASEYGYELRRRSEQFAEIAVNGNVVKYNILHDFEFNSARRRTSVIVRSPDHKIFLYVMGADDVVYDRLSPDAAFRTITSEQIVSFAHTGLRTMCVAMSEIAEHEYHEWSRQFSRARRLIRGRRVEQYKILERIERDLRLLGAVACEDKLQDEVPETIDTLIQAGIKVWMLTGDKRETAVNVGYSTKLLSSESVVCTLASENAEELRRSCVEFARKRAPTSVLVVSGNSLNVLLDSNFVEFFVSLAMRCESVICCRMMPIQKARIVHVVQNRTNSVTLAVGDGVNDVAMIQAASIGVGILGYEGTQAVHAADYSLATFKHLRRLLFVHGTLNYNRIYKVIYYSYYKNLPIGLVSLYISYAAAWSGSSFFDQWAFTFYNVLFTDGATLALGVLAEDYPEEKLVDEPVLYRRNNWCNDKTFCVCLLNGVLHSALVLFLTFRSFGTDVVWKDGYTDDYLVRGNTLYTNIVLTVMLKSYLHLLNWNNKLTFSLILFTSLMWLPVLLLYDHISEIIPINRGMLGISSMLFASPVFWLNLLLVPFTTLFLDFVIIILYRAFWFRFYIYDDTKRARL